ncbi:DUF1569 domain-containing protein [Bremerella alba]|uniref:DUF1569 domain-containing protein n=1 Tax=Bremerella alba TaxID=980252 RepID=A0A7V9A8N8_9BACT|nr:DUF1569 domain-containing protein [Bremerella alba]MBA2116483.1 hypothetical protein [Bremerella alba]
MALQSSGSTNATSPLRELTFSTLDEAVVDARRLLDTGYIRNGNWDLGQICWHIRTVQDRSIDGYPWYFGMFAFLRPIVRRTLLPKVLSGDSPRGVPTAPMFVPANELRDDEEVAALESSVERFLQHQGSFYPHPGFGSLDREMLHRVHAAHAAHHLRFLQVPSDDSVR